MIKKIFKRIMVDMSATLIHHGHIRLLKNASEFGQVVVGLTTDEEILYKKGYQPELSFRYRKEILEAIKYVDEVVATPWQITDSILDEFNIDFLVHGEDNTNSINKDRLLIFPRTKGVSSSEIRTNALKAISQKNNQKLMLTPGPSVVLYENLRYLKPIFGRGDDEYKFMSESVTNWIKKLSGQDEVVTMQGSASFALELAIHSFISGRVLLISTGFYSERLEKFLTKDCIVEICKYDELPNVKENFDWIMCAYTETSTAFRLDLETIKDKANKCKAKIFLDATASIGLEDNHKVADLMGFSSCKGLFGLTGAAFIAYKADLKPKDINNFYFNLGQMFRVLAFYHPRVISSQ